MTPLEILERDVERLKKQVGENMLRRENYKADAERILADFDKHIYDVQNALSERLSIIEAEKARMAEAASQQPVDGP
jgi:hypothetical protein